MHSLVCQTKLASKDTAATARDGQRAKDSNYLLSPDGSNEADILKAEDFGTGAGHCDTADPDEVEILALIGEEIHKYRLRTGADTDFTGYNYTDSIHRDTVPWEEDVDVSPDPIGESQQCFVLCAERVSQMTNAYDDIEAVTHLLEEKERDLELAARIGQTLLSKNKELGSRVESLEEQLTLAADKVNQLRHDLGMKDELLKYYHEDLEHETRKEPVSKSGLDLGTVDFLENKVKILEDENLNLRLESAQLRAKTDSYEEKEKKLVEDCIQQLAEVNLQVESLAEDLHQKAGENIHYKEEANKLLVQVTDLQKKIRKLTLDNMDMREKLTASLESQRKLTQELGSMQDKHDELLQMLEEAQDELRLMNKDKVHSRQHHHSGYTDSTDSLASELETSLQQELSQSGRRADSWKVFETARAAKQTAAKAAHRQVSSAAKMSLTPSIQWESGSRGPSSYTSEVESITSDSCNAVMGSFYESNSELGRPGIPGSSDLESALKRLALRRANEQNEKDFLEEEMERRQMKAQSDMHDGASQFSPNSSGLPVRQSPLDSLSSKWSNTGMPISNQHFKLPDKLQIVKPLEGSMTLRHWQRLATPHLAGIFEERDGVQMKGGNKADQTEENNYSLSDIEEDDQSHDVHTRKEQDMGLIYTFTDSTVRNFGSYGGQGNLFDSSTPLNAAHADTSITTDNEATQVPTLGSTRQQFHMSHQHQLAGDNTQSTYSMSLGLAALLQGREETGHAFMRVSASKPVTTAGELPSSSTAFSKSHLNQTLFTSRSFDSQPLTTSTPKILLGSRSFDHTMMKKEDRISLVVESESSRRPEPTGLTGKGFLQQLKSKGYSLYGLWGGSGESSHSSTESSADGESMVEDGSTSTTRAIVPAVSPNGADAGILGALTNLRRSGMF